MGDKTSIEWTRGEDGSPGATWNPLVGCTKVSPGCDNCYAETFVNRFAGHNKGFPNRFDVVTMRGEKMLAQPLRWKDPKRIFVNSLSDLFHADVPDDFIAAVFGVMAAAQRHTFQLLTKRHGRMRSLLSSHEFIEKVGVHAEGRVLSIKAGSGTRTVIPGAGADWTDSWPLPNVWLGVSVEDQQRAHLRLPALLQTPAAVRWVSAEPLLSILSLAPWLGAGDHGLAAWLGGGDRGLDWVVGGGESGPGARPMHPTWAQALRDQCAEHDVPFLFKQWGEWVTEDQSPQDITLPATSWRLLGDDGPSFWKVGKHAAGRELDGRTHDVYPQVVTA